MNRFILALACFCIPMAVFSQTANKNLPTETDTIPVQRAVVLSNIQGEILMKSASGGLALVTNGSVVQPGSNLLIRRGASFSIGSKSFAGEMHGDRWVHLAPVSGFSAPYASLGAAQGNEQARPYATAQAVEMNVFPANEVLTLSNLQGEVLMKDGSGALLPLSSGSPVASGSTLMVRNGASFSLGSRFFPAQTQGDRLIQIAGGGGHRTMITTSSSGITTVKPVIVNGPAR